MMDVLKEEYIKYQTPYLSWFGPKCVLVIDHPEDIQVVLTSKSCIEKSDLYRFFNHGAGLFGAPGKNMFAFMFWNLFVYIHMFMFILQPTFGNNNENKYRHLLTATFAGHFYQHSIKKQTNLLKISDGLDWYPQIFGCMYFGYRLW